MKKIKKEGKNYCKKWWFWIIVVAVMVLIIFFYPKSCGGGGGIGGLWTSLDCNCFGFKGYDNSMTDAVITKCFGICLKSSCETSISPPQDLTENCDEIDDSYYQTLTECDGIDKSINSLIKNSRYGCKEDSDCIISTNISVVCGTYSIIAKDADVLKRVSDIYNDFVIKKRDKNCPIPSCAPPKYGKPDKNQIKCVQGRCWDIREENDCVKTYKSIDSELKDLNYCKTDSDCKTLALGGDYIVFGCYHYINKEIDKTLICKKVRDYTNACVTAVNDCAPSPTAKCVNGKCVSK